MYTGTDGQGGGAGAPSWSKGGAAARRARGAVCWPGAGAAGCAAGGRRGARAGRLAVAGARGARRRRRARRRRWRGARGQQCGGGCGRAGRRAGAAAAGRILGQQSRPGGGPRRGTAPRGCPGARAGGGGAKGSARGSWGGQLSWDGWRRGMACGPGYCFVEAAPRAGGGRRTPGPARGGPPPTRAFGVRGWIFRGRGAAAGRPLADAGKGWRSGRGARFAEGGPGGRAASAPPAAGEEALAGRVRVPAPVLLFRKGARGPVCVGGPDNSSTSGVAAGWEPGGRRWRPGGGAGGKLGKGQPGAGAGELGCRKGNPSTGARCWAQRCLHLTYSICSERRGAGLERGRHRGRARLPGFFEGQLMGEAAPAWEPAGGGAR
jgi:hypothetical protein